MYQATSLHNAQASAPCAGIDYLFDLDTNTKVVDRFIKTTDFMPGWGCSAAATHDLDLIDLDTNTKVVYPAMGMGSGCIPGRQQHGLELTI